MSLRKNTSKTTQDLSEFLNFYNQHSYMGVARTIGAKTKGSKIGIKQPGFDTFMSIRESVSQQSYASPKSKTLNFMKDRV